MNNTIFNNNPSALQTPSKEKKSKADFNKMKKNTINSLYEVERILK